MKKIKAFFAEFGQFIKRGNILDMAVGVIIGGAFSAIVTAFTNKIIMPLINLLLSIGGTNGLEKAYTFLRKVKDASGNIDLDRSIYIDWGAFITAIINFLIIAFTLFVIIKIAMSSNKFLSESVEKVKKNIPTESEKKELEEMGVDHHNRRAYRKALAKLREDKAKAKAQSQPAPEPKKPTQEELLADILAELKKQNQADVVTLDVEEK